MATTIRINRPASPPHPPPGDFLCGFAEKDITPHPGLPLAGFSVGAEVGHGVRGHLFARALYLRDTTGADAALIVVDLLSASRLLLELVAEHTHKRCGLGIDRLFLHGSHTHTGPGWYFGNSLFDTLAAKTAGFDRAFVEWMASRVADAVADAQATARKGGVAIDHGSRIWGIARNRSVEAFEKNPGYSSWSTSGPGAGTPMTSATERYVDPRLAVITARHDRGLGVFAFFGNHPTTVGYEAPYYCADWTGEASRIARSALHAQLGQDALVAVGIRATGDVNGYRYGLDPDGPPPGHELEARVATRTGAAIAEAVMRSHAGAKAESITSWFAEPRVDDAAMQTPATRLASRWYFGDGTLGGSEERRSVFYKLRLAAEGDTDQDSFPPDDPQHPKARAFGSMQNVLKSLFNLDAPMVQPLAALRIGRTLFAGLPGEPTIMAAHHIERALLSADLDHVVVIPCTSEYGMYFATTEEYALQHYEGSSTIWGRNSVPYLQARMTALVSKPAAPAAAGTVEFTTRDDKRKFSPTDKARAGVDPRPRLTMAGAVVHVRWSMPDGARIVFANGWLARIERDVAGAWTPVMHGGRQLDDVNYPIRIQRDPGWIVDVDRTERWDLELTMPQGLEPGRYRVTLAKRDGFPGFALELNSP